ncbi:MAG: phosphatidylcholine/phosphatidylserine synthase [Pyrinomonadaceae bacterium]|nr:phosphatidylcholine/phosphatidylserine synthase [Pyrinomonadaceae bacterium]
MPAFHDSPEQINFAAGDLPADDNSVMLRKERRGLRKGLYVIPSAFTAANIGMGFYAVMGALRGFQLLEGGTDAELTRAAAHFDYAARAIGWATLFDALDGRIARMTKTTTEIGVHLDSLADVLTFGIAPAVLIYSWGYGAALAEGSNAHKLGWFLSFMFLICGAFRLARFNVQATRPRVLAEGAAKVDKKNFVGLPIPVAGGMIAALVHFSPEPLSRLAVEQGIVYSGLLMGLVALLSVLMISTVRYSSFKAVGLSRRSTQVAILLLAAIGMLIWLYSRYVLVSLLSLYILHGLLLRLASLLRSRLTFTRLVI